MLMKTLVLVRHAKAVDRHKHLSDMERALTLEGEKDARRTAKKLKAAGVVPQLFISSPANRALETAHIVADEFGYPVEKIVLKQSAYDAPDAETLLAALRDIENHHDSVVLFGHNPSLSELAENLMAGFAESLPKAGFFVISIARDGWRDLLPGDGTPSETKSKKSAKPKAAGPSSKELRQQLQPQISAGLQKLVDELFPESSRSLDKEIAKAAELLAGRLAKLKHRHSQQPAELTTEKNQTP
jgi:phosphohistidine phosphatase